jgi:hypothetical protein
MVWFDITNFSFLINITGQNGKEIRLYIVGIVTRVVENEKYFLRTNRFLYNIWIQGQGRGGRAGAHLGPQRRGTGLDELMTKAAPVDRC